MPNSNATKEEDVLWDWTTFPIVAVAAAAVVAVAAAANDIALGWNLRMLNALPST